VQGTYDNRSAGYPAEEMNRQFLSGKRLSMKMLENLKFEAPHEEVLPIWEDNV
jgi:hypothetical protein